MDIPAVTGALPVAPNPLAALFDNHDVLATWPSADTPIGVPFGAPVQRSSVRRAQPSSRAQPAPPSSAQLRTADLRAVVPSNQSGAAQRAEGPTQRSSAGPVPSAQPPAAPVEPPAPSSDGRLSAAEAAQRLLAAGAKPTLAVMTRREPPPQVVDENAEGPGPLMESSGAEVAGPFDNWPSDPPPLSPSGWVEPAPEQSGEAGPVAQSSKNSSPQQRRAAPAPSPAPVSSSGAASVVEQVPASERSSASQPSSASEPSSSPVSGPGGSSVSGGVAAWPGDPVGGAASGGAASGGVDAVAEVRRANIARVLEAGGGRPSVVVSGVPGPGSVVAPAPSPAPVSSSGAASVVEQVPASERSSASQPSSSPVSGPGGSSVSGGVAAWPGDPVGGAASGGAASGGVDAVAEVRRANIARVLEAGGGRPSVVVSGVPGPGSVVAPAPSPAPVSSSGAASVVEQVPASERSSASQPSSASEPSSSPVSGPGGSSVSGGVAAWPGDPVGGAASGGAASGGVDAVAEVRRANIARVLEAGGGRPSVVVSGVPGPGSVVAPAPSPAPVSSSGLRLWSSRFLRLSVRRRLSLRLRLCLVG
jgi:hypothetical protein